MSRGVLRSTERRPVLAGAVGPDRNARRRQRRHQPPCVEKGDVVDRADGPPAPLPPLGQYVTLVEAAILLGVRPATLRAQSGKGRLRTEKFGRDRIVRLDEVERYRREVKRSLPGSHPSARTPTSGSTDPLGPASRVVDSLGITAANPSRRDVADAVNRELAAMPNARRRRIARLLEIAAAVALRTHAHRPLTPAEDLAAQLAAELVVDVVTLAKQDPE